MGETLGSSAQDGETEAEKTTALEGRRDVGDRTRERPPAAAGMLRQDGLRARWGRQGSGPCGMGRVVGPPSPPAPRRRGPVTKLPNYRRIPQLLTGEAAANQRAALLFSGRRPGDTRTFPHPGSRG